jgi:hypothetical protein
MAGDVGIEAIPLCEEYLLVSHRMYPKKAVLLGFFLHEILKKQQEGHSESHVKSLANQPHQQRAVVIHS